MSISKDEEFRSLREEILVWQQKRFEIMKLAYVGLTVVVGGAVAQKGTWDWMLAASAVHVVLALAVHMTRACSYYTTMGGAYIEVFLDGKWDARNRAFRSGTEAPGIRRLVADAWNRAFAKEKRISVPSLNRVMAVGYLASAVTANVICLTLCGPNRLVAMIVLWLITAIVFCMELVLLAFRSFPRSEMTKRWKDIKKKELKEQGTKEPDEEE